MLYNEAICVKCTLDERSSIFIRDKHILLSERILHKDYYRKRSAKKEYGRGSQGAWIQDEMIAVNRQS
jgi:hypothetical protein